MHQSSLQIDIAQLAYVPDYHFEFPAARLHCELFNTDTCGEEQEVTEEPDKVRLTTNETGSAVRETSNTGLLNTYTYTHVHIPLHCLM